VRDGPKKPTATVDIQAITQKGRVDVVCKAFVVVFIVVVEIFIVRVGWVVVLTADIRVCGSKLQVRCDRAPMSTFRHQ
jgi:hypothetical protein